MGRVDMTITKPLPYFEVSCVCGKHFVTMGEPSENLQYLLALKTKKQKEDEFVQRGKKQLAPLLSNFIFSSFLVCFEQFEKLGKCHLKLYKRFWKCKDNRMMSKDFKLQNANWLYV
jgi:hypothetical protein